MADILALLNTIQARIQQGDPLLKRGIGVDWVCVIHPSLVTPLLEEFATHPAAGFRMTRDQRLTAICGRHCWIIDAAPISEPAYMTPAEMYRRYADWFAACARASE